MKIIYVSHWRFPSEKTMSPLIMKTCEEFVRQGMRMELWVPRRYNPALGSKDPFLYHGIARNFVIRRLFVLDWMRFPFGNLSFYLLLISFNLSLFLYILWRSERKSVFYFHDIRDSVLPLFLISNVFFEIHDFYKSKINWINRWCFSRARGFVVTNKIKMDALEREFGIFPDKLLHKPNAVDIPLFDIDISRDAARKKQGLPKDKKIILYTGHFFGWKGVDTLLMANQYLFENETIYFVGGTDEDIKVFNEKVKNTKIKNVIIVGRREHEEIPFWFKAADVLVLPNTAQDPVSKYETSPVKLFEYMASQRPIVASDLPSIRNVVNENMVLFFEPDNPESLANAIHKVFNQPEDSQKRVKQAAYEVQKFSWEKRIGAIIEFFRGRAIVI